MSPPQSGTYILDPQAIVQLQPSRLLLPTNTIAQIQSLHERSVDDNASISSSASEKSDSTSMSSSRFELDSLTAALSMIIPLSEKLYEASAIYEYCNSLDYDLPGPPAGCGYMDDAYIAPIQSFAATDARHQFHPFLLPWPTSPQQWDNAVRKYIDQAPPVAESQPHSSAASVSSFTAAATADSSDHTNHQQTSHIACAGATNEACALTDSEIAHACDAGILPLPDGVHNPYSWPLSRWKCALKCPVEHQLRCAPEMNCSTCSEYPAEMMLCACHLQLLRGCMWPNCARGEHVTRRLIAKMIGITDPITLSTMDGLESFYRPRERTDWSNIFRVSRAKIDAPALTEEELEKVRNSGYVSCKAFAPLSASIAPELSAQLTSTFPWSLDNTSRGTRCFTATPSFIVSPIAPGWIGGFIGLSNSSIMR